MDDIPFSLSTERGNVGGFLRAPQGAGFTTERLQSIFHVIERRKDGNYYRGQLMLNPFKGWWLPDSPLEEHANYLGDIVQQWYE